jgi:alpha/beta superfamily hydrolase
MRYEPVYLKKKKKMHLIGSGCLVLGVLGLIIPGLPGIVFILLGISVLSFSLPSMRGFFAKIEARFPKAREGLETLEGQVSRVFDIAVSTREFVSVVTGDARTLSVLVDTPTFPTQGVAIISHGATGTKDTPLMNMLADMCVARGLVVVRYDAYHGLGKSEGAYTAYTVSSHVEDLGAVVAWVRTQAWGEEGVRVLVGHSSGALASGVYASKHTEEVDELILVAPTFSGKVYQEVCEQTEPDAFRLWRETGVRVVEHPLSGEKQGLGFSFVEDAHTYDLFSLTALIPKHTFVCAGDVDLTAREALCREFVRAVGNDARFALARGVTHFPHDDHALSRLRVALESILP